MMSTHTLSWGFGALGDMETPDWCDVPFVKLALHLSEVDLDIRKS
jgi:hypothetical protein